MDGQGCWVGRGLGGVGLLCLSIIYSNFLIKSDVVCEIPPTEVETRRGSRGEEVEEARPIRRSCLSIYDACIHIVPALDLQTKLSPEAEISENEKRSPIFIAALLLFFTFFYTPFFPPLLLCLACLECRVVCE